MSLQEGSTARQGLADVELVAQLRGAFAQAQTIVGHTLAELSLTEQRYHLMLMVAAGEPGGTVQGTLARELHCPESRISLLVRELGDAGLVETIRDEDDRRLVRVRLSADGEEILGQAISVQRDALRGLVAELDATEVTHLAETVARTYLGLDLTVSLKLPRQ